MADVLSRLPVPTNKQAGSTAQKPKDEATWSHESSPIEQESERPLSTGLKVREPSRINGSDGRDGQRSNAQEHVPDSQAVMFGLARDEGLSRKEDHDALTPSPLTQPRTEPTGQEAESYGDEPSSATTTQGEKKEKVLNLTPAKIYEVSSLPKSLSKQASFDEVDGLSDQRPFDTPITWDRWTISKPSPRRVLNGEGERTKDRSQPTSVITALTTEVEGNLVAPQIFSSKDSDHISRPHSTARTISTPLSRRRLSSVKAAGSAKSPPSSSSKQSKIGPQPLRFADSKMANRLSEVEDPEPSPMPPSIPVPPLSLPTYLQLELSSQRPSPMYIHRSAANDLPYESSHVKIERLQNFFLLPPQLEQVLWFGALACLDAWLFSFTILPLRFLNALSILCRSWGRNVATEIKSTGSFIYAGTGRMWRRRRRESMDGSPSSYPTAEQPPSKAQANGTPASKPSQPENAAASHPTPKKGCKRRLSSAQKHRRTKSTPSGLLPDHKADILKGLLILISCTILMYFDASRMYHGIRGQAAIKLYVIYNVLEVCDRLFSALGQDVLECLFSKEALERKPDGRSKVLRPFWLFTLALCYNLIHATALFYQVITLNVAVNSYSNALLTLLMSNQFVEIKSTVFKKFEKENLFQLTCADVVERFQLWLMLMIIASRNIIETGGVSLGAGGESSSASSSGSSGILPKSFTLFPEWAGQIMGPFFLVLGSEMLVDWIKHAYITKFNNIKPAIYGRFLDVLAKDYYSNAFADQNLTRRLGLPVIPLACLFIRASVQTYHMFLTTHMPLPFPSTATSLSVDSATTSPATTAALEHIDLIFRRALGRSTFGAGSGPTLSPTTSSIWNTDDIIACITMVVFFLVLFLVLLALKLVLGMCLLSFARSRYKGMKERENTSAFANGRRVGGWGVVEVDEDKRRWIYLDDPDGAKRLRERERDVREKETKGGETFMGVSRYDMVAKRIW